MFTPCLLQRTVWKWILSPLVIEDLDGSSSVSGGFGGNSYLLFFNTKDEKEESVT